VSFYSQRASLRWGFYSEITKWRKGALVFTAEVRSSPPAAAAADLTYSPRANAALSPLGFYSGAAPAARDPLWKIKCCQGRCSTRAFLRGDQRR